MTESVLRTIIVDDEPLARRLLRAMLDDIPEVEVVAECENGREAIESTRELAPDLLILDIQMPGLTGFDVVKGLQADLVPNVIFCTAYQRYAVDAFDLHAVDYLLKPLDEGRLQRAIQRALQRAGEAAELADNKSPLLGAIDEISRKVAAPRKDPRIQSPDSAPEQVLQEKLAVKTQDSTILVNIEDIDWIDAAGDYMCLHVKGETLILRSTLRSLMHRLDPDIFKRIHRSTVVNLARIQKATPLKKGEYMLDLGNEIQLKVSRNYRDAIKTFLDGRQA